MAVQDVHDIGAGEEGLGELVQDSGLGIGEVHASKIYGVRINAKMQIAVTAHKK
tara:strand:- start:214 stop:375 length:162 start_codon:yes stop_codon:yes gene_type:complete